ncbi:hypothetical protein J4206_04710 [Candidatus Woesearchaeota archaeon]|nr:hypothetical protein [Candidatus Woesearchaeota archaeon]
MLSLDNLQFKSSKDYYDYLMFQIQERLVAIDELKSNNTNFSELVKQVSDLAVLSKLLAISEGVDEQILNQRLQELKSKVISS